MLLLLLRGVVAYRDLHTTEWRRFFGCVSSSATTAVIKAATVDLIITSTCAAAVAEVIPITFALGSVGNAAATDCGGGVGGVQQTRSADKATVGSTAGILEII